MKTALDLLCAAALAGFAASTFVHIRGLTGAGAAWPLVVGVFSAGVALTLTVLLAGASIFVVYDAALAGRLQPVRLAVWVIIALAGVTGLIYLISQVEMPWRIMLRCAGLRRSDGAWGLPRGGGGGGASSSRGVALASSRLGCTS